MEINKLYNEDCIDGMKKIPSASIDMVLTDPPYTSPTVHEFGRQKVNRLSDLAIQEFYFAEIKKEWERILKPNAPVYRDWETDRKSTRLNSSHRSLSRMPSSA